jgi:hypothetical protein
MSVDRPRTFQELVAAQSPEDKARWANSESFSDPSLEGDLHREVIVIEDAKEPGAWRVEYQDEDGGCYVTIFAGPAAEPRARGYFRALRNHRIKVIRDRTEH